MEDRKPVPLMVKVCAPAPTIVEEGERLVKVGAGLLTVRVKFWVASLPIPL